jgi:hypothetical protein
LKAFKVPGAFTNLQTTDFSSTRDTFSPSAAFFKFANFKLYATLAMGSSNTAYEPYSSVSPSLICRIISTPVVFNIGVNSRIRRNSSKSIFGSISHAFAGTTLTTGFFPDDVINIFKRLLEHIAFCFGLIHLITAANISYTNTNTGALFRA